MLLRSGIKRFKKIISASRAVTRSSMEREVFGWNFGPVKSNTWCCPRLATAVTFLQKKLCWPGAMTQRWAPKTRNTLWRNTASMMKDLIWSQLLGFLDKQQIQWARIQRNPQKHRIFRNSYTEANSSKTQSMRIDNKIFPKCYLQWQVICSFNNNMDCIWLQIFWWVWRQTSMKKSKYCGAIAYFLYNNLYAIKYVFCRNFSNIVEPSKPWSNIGQTLL